MSAPRMDALQLRNSMSAMDGTRETYSPDRCAVCGCYHDPPDVDVRPVRGVPTCEDCHAWIEGE